METLHPVKYKIINSFTFPLMYMYIYMYYLQWLNVHVAIAVYQSSHLKLLAKKCTNKNHIANGYSTDHGKGTCTL